MSFEFICAKCGDTCHIAQLVGKRKNSNRKAICLRCNRELQQEREDKRGQRPTKTH